MAVVSESFDTPVRQPVGARPLDAAQRELDALRAAIDARLAALESAIADPARSESLERLILDLARTASDEAQAAAARACAAVRADARAQLAEAGAEAAAALDDERRAGAELRRALERSEVRLAALERAAEPGQLADDLARVRATAAELQEALLEATRSLHAERILNIELRAMADEAEQRAAVTLAATRLAASRPAVAPAPAANLRGEADSTVGGNETAITRPHDPASPAPAAAPGLPAQAPAARFDTPAALTDAGASAAASAENAWRAVRLATRYAFRQPVAAQVNGTLGMLSDLSITGCQVVSPISLKPGQLLKVLIPWDGTTIACAGRVAWAKLEMPGGGGRLGYRAGVEFTKADREVIEAFIAHHTAMV
jgi:hypothetical protein